MAFFTSCKKELPEVPDPIITEQRTTSFLITDPNYFDGVRLIITEQEDGNTSLEVKSINDENLIDTLFFFLKKGTCFLEDSTLLLSFNSYKLSNGSYYIYELDDGTPFTYDDFLLVDGHVEVYNKVNQRIYSGEVGANSTWDKQITFENEYCYPAGQGETVMFFYPKANNLIYSDLHICGNINDILSIDGTIHSQLWSGSDTSAISAKLSDFNFIENNCDHHYIHLFDKFSDGSPFTFEELNTVDAHMRIYKNSNILTKVNIGINK